MKCKWQLAVKLIGSFFLFVNRNCVDCTKRYRGYFNREIIVQQLRNLVLAVVDEKFGPKRRHLKYDVTVC